MEQCLKKTFIIINQPGLDAVNRSCSTRKFLSKTSEYSRENICAGVSLLIKMQILFIKETPAQLFSYNFLRNI